MGDDGGERVADDDIPSGASPGKLQLTELLIPVDALSKSHSMS